MGEFVEKDSFEFGNVTNNEENNFEYSNISGLGESNYENDDIFNQSVEANSEVNQVSNVPEFNFEVPVETNIFNPSFDVSNDGPIMGQQSESFDEVSEPINVFELSNLEEEPTNTFNERVVEETIQDPIRVFEEPEIVPEETPVLEAENNFFEEPSFENSNFTFGTAEETDNVEQGFEVEEIQNLMPTEKVDKEFLEENPETFSSSMNDNFEYDVVEPTATSIAEEKNVATNNISDTPIEELNKLTEYKEEKISATDIKALFNKVGSNVQEASDIFMKNTEMKEKLDAKFEELKQLQETVENAKKTQYDEINAYKEEVYGKLTEKKQEVEDRINKLKEFQANLEREKEEFEKYKKEQTDDIERVQKEVQDAYDSRREELNHIEDVLRRQKDALDEERNQLSLDKIQYEADKNELANNLLKFNQIVDSFTIGMESTGKEE